MRVEIYKSELTALLQVSYGIEQHLLDSTLKGGLNRKNFDPFRDAVHADFSMQSVFYSVFCYHL